MEGDPKHLLERIFVRGEPSQVPDEKTRDEVDDYEAQRKELELESQKQDMDARKQYAGRLFWLLCVWLGAIFLLVLLDGAGYLRVADSVQIALISAATVKVIGLFAFVAAYLYYRPRK